MLFAHKKSIENFKKKFGLQYYENTIFCQKHDACLNVVAFLVSISTYHIDKKEKTHRVII